MKQEKNQESSLESYLKCKDFLVSGETFELLYNKELNLLKTSPFPDNVSKYYESKDYISHSKKQKGFMPLLYRLVRNYSLKKKEKLIGSFNLQKTVLDVGTGTGNFLSFCKSKGWNVFGTEPNSKARAIAKESGIEVFKEINEIENKSFSIITLWHVLEHVSNLSETISILDQLLSKNGRLIIAVPNFESYDAKYYKEFWAAYDVPRHLWHFSKKSISKLFMDFDLEVEKTLPMKFDSYYVSLLSEKHKTGKNNFFRAFLIGFLSNIKGKKKKNYSSMIYVLKKQNKNL